MSIDPSSIVKAECEKYPFPLKELRLSQRPHGFQIVISQSLLAEMKEYGRKNRNVEVGGILVGNLCWDGEPFVFVKHFIEGKHANNNRATVTFTFEMWEHVHQQVKKKFPQSRIVGWYHTHPGFGIFLSGNDLFVFQNTFFAPFHVAYQFDPHKDNSPKHQGFYVWKDGGIVSQVPHVVEGIQIPHCVTKPKKRFLEYLNPLPYLFPPKAKPTSSPQIFNENSLDTWVTTYSSGKLVKENKNKSDSVIRITFDDEPDIRTPGIQ